MTPLPSPLIFCLRVAEFPAQALVRLRPTLRKTAVAILEGEPPLQTICAATLQARRLGVRHGLTRTEAESFPALTLLRRSPAEEKRAAVVLLEMAARFTPRFQEFRDDLPIPASPRHSTFVLTLDMTGSERIFGSPTAIGHKLLRSAHDLGFTARVAASRNLHTAVCLTRAPGDSLQVVPPGEERARLHDLPLSALGLSDELADTFNAWGLRSIGELAAFPPEDVIARLGQGGHRLLRLARGEEPHLFVPIEPAFALEEHLAVDTPVDNLDSLLFVLAPMLDQLILRARNRALLLASITIQLHLERSEDAADRNLESESVAPPIADSSRAVASMPPQIPLQTASHPVHQRTLKPALPLDDRTLLLKLLQLDLQANPPPAGIVAVTLTAAPGPRPGVQSGLFSPQLPEPMRLEVTLARLAALVGEDRVGQAVLTDTHQPEAFRMERLTLHESTPRKARQPLVASHTARTGIALRRLRPPKFVQVWQVDGRLHAFAIHENTQGNGRYTVQRAFGPWRRSGHWWSGAAWSREEWDIDASSGDGSRLLCLLAHDLLCKRWLLEALYD